MVHFDAIQCDLMLLQHNMVGYIMAPGWKGTLSFYYLLISLKEVASLRHSSFVISISS